jgi:multimeric flavodoxin WrbA
MTVGAVMKVLIVNGSPRAGGNSYWLSQQLMEKYADEECECVNLRELSFTNCGGCANCRSGAGICETEDGLKDVLPKLLETDLQILISPNYYSAVTGICKIYLDRWSCLRKKSGIPQFRPEQKIFFVFVQGSPNRGHGEAAVQWAKNLFTNYGLKYYGMVIPNCASGSRDGIRLKLDEIKMNLNMFV